MCVVLRHCVAVLGYLVYCRATPCVDIYRSFGTPELYQQNAADIRLLVSRIKMKLHKTRRNQKPDSGLYYQEIKCIHVTGSLHLVSLPVKHPMLNGLKSMMTSSPTILWAISLLQSTVADSPERAPYTNAGLHPAHYATSGQTALKGRTISVRHPSSLFRKQEKSPRKREVNQALPRPSRSGFYLYRLIFFGHLRQTFEI